MKLERVSDWLRLAKATVELEGLNISTEPRSLAKYLPYSEWEIRDTQRDTMYCEMLSARRQQKFDLWVELLAKEPEEVRRVIRENSLLAALRISEILKSSESKNRDVIAASRLNFDFDPEMERPVVRHEITNRFTQEELDEATRIIRRLKSNDLSRNAVGTPPAAERPN